MLAVAMLMRQLIGHYVGTLTQQAHCLSDGRACAAHRVKEQRGLLHSQPALSREVSPWSATMKMLSHARLIVRKRDPDEETLVLQCRRCGVSTTKTRKCDAAGTIAH
jgi:hypothetical protein